MKRQLDREITQQAIATAAEKRFFLASALAAYCSLRSIDDIALASHLGCSPEDLVRLALCRRPNSGSSAFRTEVEQIATYASAMGERLAQLVREVEAFEALQAAESATRPGRGLLMAARDRDDEEAEPAKDASMRRRPKGNQGRGSKA